MQYDHNFSSVLPLILGRLVPPDLGHEVEAGPIAAPNEPDYFALCLNPFVETLRFRREMHQEFAR